MDYAIFLPRRLSHAGCIVAGTKLATHHEALAKELKQLKTKLAPKVESAVIAVVEKTKALELLSSSDATMVEIDRGTDRCIAGFNDQLDAIERCFDHASILPLTESETSRLADATLVRSVALPHGTGFIKLVYTQQWVHMSAMVTALGGAETAAAVERLGLTAEADRLRRWVGLYGAKLGVTEQKHADPAVIAIEAWHAAYGALFTHVHSEYDDDKDDLHAKIRDVLTSPYNTQADEERRAEQKAKAKRKRDPADQ
jgi:hypothetical protein